MSQVSPARYVPYGYARQNQLLVSGVSGDAIEVWIGDATPEHAIAELTRTLPLRVVPVRKPGPELAAAIARAYAQQEGSAASVVDEVESDLKEIKEEIRDIKKAQRAAEAELVRLVETTL